ncbi:MAG: hypothetical protein KJ626_14345 [Verrucomicrobia bacterium]|nr:hypothetical protein [Verrucomicrobiota bacterium]
MRSILAITLVISISVGSALAADTYQASLKAGDEMMGQQNYAGALAEYTAAVGQAATDTETALAYSKKAYVLAFKEKNYAAAKEQAEKALAITDVQPIGHVSALQALAECQMKVGEDYASAATTLKKAAALEGVDWAQPEIHMALGEACRFSAQFDEAVRVYGELIEMPNVSVGMKATAYLNKGTTHQYSLKQNAAARNAYAEAVALKPDLQGLVDGHLARMQ